MSNEELIAGIQAGETQLLEALLHRNKGFIHKLAIRRESIMQWIASVRAKNGGQ